MKMLFLLVSLISLNVVVLLSDDLAYSDTNNVCTSGKTCGECVKNLGCYFCEDEVFDKSRCDLVENLKSNNCKSFKRPETNVTKVTTADDNNARIDSKEIYVKAPLFQDTKVSFKVTNKKNFPLDLYILIDLTASMMDDISLVKRVSQKIADELSGITSNFKIGLGSFLDKTAEPQMNINYMKNANAEIYTVRQYSALTSDMNVFKASINKAVTSTNVDLPEGIFDGVLQVSVCGEKVGWREDARKILLVMSDDLPQAAGVEYLTGIFEPATARCQLEMVTTGTGDYLQWDGLSMGYPSIGLIRQVLVSKSIIPIFAHDKKYTAGYNRIKDFLAPAGAAIGTYEKNDEQFVKFIKDKYKEVTKDIVYQNVSSESVQIKAVAVECPKNKLLTNAYKCENVEDEESASFEITLAPTVCGDNGNVKVTIPAYGSVLVYVQGDCDCQCSKVDEKASTKCSTKGSLQCSVCACDEGYSGSDCSCLGDASEKNKLCVNANSNKLCNEQGQCNCGKCTCNEKFYGETCQCRDDNCPKLDGVLCGGTDRGTCQCGTCKCKDEYTGINCGAKNCAFVAGQCKKDDKVCSESGQCVCGECNCDQGYSGQFCEVCWKCDLKCEKYAGLVFTKIFPELTPEEYNIQVGECTNCEFVEVTDINELSNNKCTNSVNKCSWFFSFTLSGEGKQGVTVKYLKLDKEQYCSKGINLPAVIGASLGIILVLGILIIVGCKMIIVFLDRREYKKLMDAEHAAKFGKASNPIYTKANTAVNPGIKNIEVVPQDVW